MSVLKRFEDLYETIQLTGLLYGKAAKVFCISGRRAGFTSTTLPNDIKEFDNAVADTPALSAATLDIISSSANDITAGTGVRTVKVTYIDSSNNLVESPAIALNGTTLVTSVLTGVNGVLWMETATAGSGGVAAGNIRLRINGGIVEVEQITAASNKSLSGRFMVPTGHTAYVHYWCCNSVSQDQDVRLQAQVNSLDRSLSSVFHVVANNAVAANVSLQSYLGFLKFPALSRIKVTTISGGTGATVKCNTSFVVVLLAD